VERTLSQVLPGANKVVNALRLRSKAGADSEKMDSVVKNLNMVLTIITIKTITQHHFSNNNFQIIRQQLNRLLNALQTYCMMLPLNLNPQLYATSALWANDSTMENIMLAYSEI
jgi:hypothetical protein